MSRSRAQVFIGLSLFLLAFSTASSAVAFGQPLQYPLLIFAAAILFIIAFINTDFALFILLFSMILSPEIRTGVIKGREVMIRADDILIMVVFLGWIAKMGVNKELGLLKPTPLNAPNLIYIFISVIATLYGSFKGYVRLKDGIFYLIKYFEYFLLYFMVINNLKSLRQIKLLVFSMIFILFVISLYAFNQHYSGIERASAPFQEAKGESNTLGGYLVLMIMVVAGLLLNTGSLKVKGVLSAVLFFALPALLFTLSRGSWLGFLFAYLALMALTPKGKLSLFVILLVMVLFSSVLLPDYFHKRLTSTFEGEGGKEYSLMGRNITLEGSAAARIITWQTSLRLCKKEPVLGFGAGSMGPVIDNQFARLLLEVGILGLLAFSWIIFAMFRKFLEIRFKLENDEFSRGLIIGFLAGLAGLLVHGFGAATFIIIRIMEPFWFLAAIIVTLPEFVPVKEPKPQASIA